MTVMMIVMICNGSDPDNALQVTADVMIVQIHDVNAMRSERQRCYIWRQGSLNTLV